MIVFVLTITVISALVVTLATFGMKTMTDAYFYSQLEEINEMVSTVQAMGESNDQIYDRMKRADIRINKFYPFAPDDTNEKDYKDDWAYSIVFDSAGTYIHHPDKQRVGKTRFFDDIRKSPTHAINKLSKGLTPGERGENRIIIDGSTSYIFYTRAKDGPWVNAIIVPVHGLRIPTILTGLILLMVIGIGLSVAYWVSRRRRGGKGKFPEPAARTEVQRRDQSVAQLFRQYAAFTHAVYRPAEEHHRPEGCH